MPRYLLETGPMSTADVRDAARLAARRFPEVVVDDRYVAHDDTPRELWVCHAPSAAHLQRWATAAHLDVRSVTHVDADAVPQDPPRVGPPRVPQAPPSHTPWPPW
jgi:hypothetical protein